MERTAKSKERFRTEKNLYLFTKELFESDRSSDQSAILKRYCEWRCSFPNGERPCYCGHTTDCECGDPGISEFKSGILNYGISGEDLLKSFCHPPAEDK